MSEAEMYEMKYKPLLNFLRFKNLKKSRVAWVGYIIYQKQIKNTDQAKSHQTKLFALCKIILLYQCKMESIIIENILFACQLFCRIPCTLIKQ